MKKTVLMLMVIVLCWGAALAWAGDPAWRYDQPVKLDSSGRPIYNSWQSRESQRQSRPSDRTSVIMTTGSTQGVVPVSLSGVNPGQAVPVQNAHTSSIPQEKAQILPEMANPQGGSYYANPATRVAGDSAINPAPPVNTYIQVNEDPIPVNTNSQSSQ